jgi:hypothetical protein
MTNNTRKEVARLHSQGLGTTAIADALDIRKSSVSYHKAMLGLSPIKNDINWNALQDRLDSGATRAEVLKEFRIGIQRYTRARQDGIIRGKSHSPYMIEECLVFDSPVSRNTLKRQLLQQGLIENKCQLCDCLPEWYGKPLVLVLDHINGVNNDNRIENLRLLCPNCNSQTETFAGRNAKRNRASK